MQTKVEFIENESMKETCRVMKDRNPVIFTLILFLIMQVVSAIGISILSLLGKNILNINLKGDSLNIAILISTLMVSIATYFFVKVYQKRTAKSMGLVSDNKIKSYFLGIGISFIMLSLAFSLTTLFGGYDIKINTKNVNPLVFVFFIFGWMCQGFEEEFIVRSAIMNYFASRSGVFVGLVANSLIFAILHLGNSSFNLLAFINLFIIGLVFSMLFYLTDNIYTSAGAHSMWNFMQANIVGINVSGIISSKNSIFKSNPTGYALISGGAFGIEASILVTLVGTLSLVILYKISIKKNLIKKEK